MSEYIIKTTNMPENVREALSTWYEIDEEVVRCRDCKHATISILGLCKYCEMFVLPDQDGFGPDPQVNLPLDFFCAYGERRES